MEGVAIRRLVARSRPSSEIGERDLRILETLAWASIMSTSQVHRLFVPSRRRAQRRLRALFDHGLVRAHLQGAALHEENVYTLTPRGLEVLVEGGSFSEGEIRPGRLPRPQKLAHALAIRDVFVAFLLAEREEKLFLRDFRFDSELAGEAILNALGLIPDAMAITENGGAEQVAYVEVDLGTETRATIVAKLEAWSRFFFGLGPEAVETTKLLVVTDRAARQRLLARAVEEAGLGPVAVVTSFAELPGAVLAPHPRPQAAPPGRAARIGTGAEIANQTAVFVAVVPAFRPLRER